MLKGDEWCYPFCETLCEVKIFREKVTCCMLLTRAGIGAWSPQAQPLSGLFDCEEQPTREQEVGSKMEEP